jgi:hypothetical protein
VILTAVILRVHRAGRFGDEPPDWAMRLCLLDVKKEKVNLIVIQTDKSTLI